MSIYTVYAVPAADPATPPYQAGDPERIVFVRDGFDRAAFFFGPFWLALHRLWLVLAAYLIVVVALFAANAAWSNSPSSWLLISLALAAVMGLEGGTLRRWTLARNGYREIGLVAADTLEAAERRFFEHWRTTAETPAPSSPPSPLPVAMRPAGRDEAGGVIGLFPEPGRSR